jgi:hypothetical protein
MLRSVAPRSTERVSTICEGFGSTQHSEQGVHNIQGNAGMATPREHRRIGAQHVGRPNRHRLGTVAPCPPPPVNRCSPTWNGSRTLRLIARPWRRGSRGSPGSCPSQPPCWAGQALDPARFLLTLSHSGSPCLCLRPVLIAKGETETTNDGEGE